MEIRINIPEKLANAARERGVPVEVYVQELLAGQSSDASAKLQAVQSAIDRIRQLRKGNHLAGLRTKDLVHEGHRF
ncbi:MAG TPA: hypothetical protein VFP96_01700 [Candidatus Acidoferrum sp.]|nr:hypothetical protein [Candidatus Acidoferrum sp.]HET9801927.1 hypothetical protein [Candidatus Acidoferrum sp.]HEU5410710.1 hypothetical protein [Candidatus Acidoferrales bacterium]